MTLFRTRRTAGPAVALWAMAGLRCASTRPAVAHRGAFKGGIPARRDYAVTRCRGRPDQPKVAEEDRLTPAARLLAARFRLDRELLTKERRRGSSYLTGAKASQSAPSPV